MDSTIKNRNNFPSHVTESDRPAVSNWMEAVRYWMALTSPDFKKWYAKKTIALLEASPPEDEDLAKLLKKKFNVMANEGIKFGHDILDPWITKNPLNKCEDNPEELTVHLIYLFPSVSGLEHLDIFPIDVRELACASFLIAAEIASGICYLLKDKVVLPVVLSYMGSGLASAGSLWRAVKKRKTAENFLRELAKQWPRLFSNELALNCNNLGALYLKIGKLGYARDQFENALEIRRKLVLHEPETYLPDLAVSLSNLGALFGELKEHDLSREHLEEAIQVRRQLANIAPEKYQPSLATTCYNLGITLFNNKNWGPAKEWLEEAIQLYRQIVIYDPETFFPDLAKSCDDLADLLIEIKAYGPARKYFEEACNIYHMLVDIDYEKYLPKFFEICNNLGNLYCDISEYDLAKRLYDHAYRVCLEQIKNGSSAYLPQLATISSNLGSLLSDIGIYNMAREMFEGSYKTYNILMEDDSETYLPLLATACNNLGTLLLRAENYIQARKYYEESIANFQQLANRDPDVFLPNVALSCNNLGVLFSEIEDYGKAIQYYEEAIQIWSELVDVNPIKYLPQLAIVLNNMGTLLSEIGKYDDARKRYKEALSTAERAASLLSTHYAHIAKGKIKSAYKFLMDDYRKQRKNKKNVSLLLSLLESKRVPKAESLVEQDRVIDRYRKILDRPEYTALLLVEETREGTLFIYQQKKDAIPQIFFQKNLKRGSRFRVASASLYYCAHTIKKDLYKQNLNISILRKCGERVFSALPNKIQKYLTNTYLKHLIISVGYPHENLPWGLLETPGGPLGAQIDITMDLSPGHRLELTKHWHVADEPPTIILVADPSGDLSWSRKEALELKRKFVETEKKYKDLDMKVKDFIGSEATVDDIKENIMRYQSSLRLFHYTGHGAITLPTRFKHEYGMSYETISKLSEISLKMYEEKMFTRIHLNGIYFNNCPIVVLNACVAATLDEERGWRNSFPDELLRRGAQAVIASSFPTIDSPSVIEFSSTFYDRLVEYGETAGVAYRAALKAARGTAKRITKEAGLSEDYTRITWGLFKFYGNPDARF